MRTTFIFGSTTPISGRRVTYAWDSGPSKPPTENPRGLRTNMIYDPTGIGAKRKDYEADEPAVVEKPK
jgi:hypothetical protein